MPHKVMKKIAEKGKPKIMPPGGMGGKRYTTDVAVREARERKKIENALNVLGVKVAKREEFIRRQLEELKEGRTKIPGNSLQQKARKEGNLAYVRKILGDKADQYWELLRA